MQSDEAWERILDAKLYGGMCAACGRALDAGEPVWHQRLDMRLRWGASFEETYRRAFVGRECAAPELLRETEGREPVACRGCGRPMYVAAQSLRRPALCSRRCRTPDARRRRTDRRPA